MATRPETARRRQLFRLYEGALRKTETTYLIRRELIGLGVTVEQLHAFKISVQKLIRSERNTR